MALYNKNEKTTLLITDMTKEGLGLSKLDGQVFFVKDGLIGDEVEAKVTKVAKNVIYAKAINIIKRSKYRVNSDCKVSSSCGGCQLLNLQYSKQLELKKKYVLDCLSKIGKIDVGINVDAEVNANVRAKANVGANANVGASYASPFQGITGMHTPFHFRNKMQVPYVYRDGKIIYGFYAGRTHHIIEFTDCIVGFAGAKIILDAIKEAIQKFNISVYDEKSGFGAFREVMLRKGNETNEVSITYIINDSNYKEHLELYKKFDEFVIEVCKSKLNDKDGNSNDMSNCKDCKQCEHISNCKGELCESMLDLVTSTLNINTKNNNTIFGNKNIILRGRGYIEDNIGDIRYQVSPESFYQINMEMTEKLYEKVLEYASFNGSEKVLDLYSGIGTIALYVAKYAKKVFGIEIVEKAVENAVNNAKINSINNAGFIVADIEKNSLDDIINKHKENFNEGNSKVDIVIVDPPRSGLDENAIKFIKNLEPKRIIYVSCDPATLARDLDRLCHKTNNSDEEKMYQVNGLECFDMFPHTMHVETVCLLSNRKPDARVKIDVDLEDYYRIKDEQKKNKASE